MRGPTLAASCCAAFVSAQTPQPAADTYEVASIKLATDKTVSRWFTFPGGRIELGKQSLRDLLVWAYDLNCAGDACSNIVLDGPPWIGSLRFEIVAQPAQPDPVVDMPARQQRTKPRIRALLAERFQLRVRSEEKEMAVYALRIAKDGPKMQEGTDSSGSQRMAMSGPFWATFGDSPIRPLIGLLGRITGRPAVDRTGLTGVYSFGLLWDPGYPVPKEAMGALTELPSIFAAVREQLGLTLQPERGMVKIVRIEHVEMPTAN